MTSNGFAQGFAGMRVINLLIALPTDNKNLTTAIMFDSCPAALQETILALLKADRFVEAKQIYSSLFSFSVTDFVPLAGFTPSCFNQQE